MNRKVSISGGLCHAHYVMRSSLNIHARAHTIYADVYAYSVTYAGVSQFDN